MPQKKKLILYLILTSSVFLGLMLNENSSGGSRIDHNYLLPYIIEFSQDFSSGLNLFVNNPGSLVHSPFFYIISGFLLKIFNNIFFVKILYLVVCSILPYIFYLILKTKYKVNYEYLFYISLIIFLSPYFRSSAIWLLGDNLSIIFFSLSILFFLKTLDNSKKLSNYYFCIFFLILCCYIRYYYFLFFFYFLFEFYKKLEIGDLIKIIFLSFIISIPEIIYLIYIIVNYDFVNFISERANGNYFTNFIVIFTILLFYLIPFFFIQFIDILKFYRSNLKNFFIIFSITILFFLTDRYFDDFINFQSNLGGGVFVKFLKIFNYNLEIIFLVIFCFSFLLIDYIFRGNRIRNYIILIILILCFPMPIIYQKYLDPLFFVIFLGLIQSENLKKMFEDKVIRLIPLYLYFSLFLLFSINYYSL